MDSLASTSARAVRVGRTLAPDNTRLASHRQSAISCEPVGFRGATAFGRFRVVEQLPVARFIEARNQRAGACSGTVSDPEYSSDWVQVPEPYSPAPSTLATAEAVATLRSRRNKHQETQLAAGQSDPAAGAAHARTRSDLQTCKSHGTRNFCRSLSCNYCAPPQRSLCPGSSQAKGHAHCASPVPHARMNTPPPGHTCHTAPNACTSPSCTSRFDS